MERASIESLNPSNAKIIQREFLDDDYLLERKIDASYKNFYIWRGTSMNTRCELIENLSTSLNNEKDKLATILTKEIGKPIRQARAEIEKCIELCLFYAKNGPQYLSEDSKILNGELNLTCYEPLGPTLGIMPWNYPFWQTMRFAVPAMLAGNTVLLKLAKNATACAQEVKKVFSEAGFHEGIFDTVFVDYQQTGKIIEDKRIRGLSFTGSTEAGKSIASGAGQSLKKCVLELGGSDPYIVLEDANLENAVHHCAEARLTNSGQSCIAAKRIIVQSSVYEEFLQLFVEKCKEKRVGNPELEETDVGPLAKESVKSNLDRQVLESLNQGAKAVYSSDENYNEGYFYPITVLKDVPLSSPVMTEETFGPVAAVVEAVNGVEALMIANSSRFGLGSAIFTSDEKKALELARGLESGMCAINRAVKSHWELPFGGVKDSGYGRELGVSGVKSFVNEKVIMSIPMADIK